MTMSCCFKSLFGVEPRSEADAFILLTLFMCYDLPRGMIMHGGNRNCPFVRQRIKAVGATALKTLKD